MQPMQLIWAGVVVIVQAPPPRLDDDVVLHQVSAWLSGLRQGVQAAPPLPAFPAVPHQARPQPAGERAETPLPGFYL
jgi:hypothetical protein